MSYVIGLDIGTTSTIGILCNLESGKYHTSSRPVTLNSPHPGWAEEDPGQWWNNVCEICHELMSLAPSAQSELAGIGVTGMVPAVILLGRDDQLLRPSIQQSDARCGAEVEELLDEVDAHEFTLRTGNGINQQLVIAKLRWLEKNEPETYSKIATVFGSYDYINWMLTGQKRVERNWALEGGFVDLKTGLIEQSLTNLSHLPPSAFPQIIRSDDISGRVNEWAAHQTGLPFNVPVCGGAADHVASAFAAGVIEQGDVLLKFGGSGDILMTTTAPTPDPRMYLDFHLIPGLCMPNGCMATTGSLLNWATKTLLSGAQANADTLGEGIHQYLDTLASRIPPGSEGLTVLPYFLGEKTPIHDPFASGTIVGLGLHHEMGHVWRALLEGIAYAFRHHLDVMSDMGHIAQKVLASDGGSRSRIWMEIVANVIQRPIQLLQGHPGSCLGGAWAAAMATGVASDWQGVIQFVSYGEQIMPNSAYAALYDEGYERYCSLYAALKPWFRKFYRAQ